MSALILKYSIHHGNTNRVVERLAETYGCDVIDVVQKGAIDLKDYDAIILASGVYYFGIGKPLLQCVEQNLQQFRGKRIGLLLTSGMQQSRFMDSAVQVLEELGLQVEVRFQCLGYDTFGPLKLIGGISKGRPNESDLQNAVDAFQNLLEK